MTEQNIPAYEPVSFAAGQTLAWTKELADYSPADGWTLKTYFRGMSGAGFDAEGEADDNHFSFRVPSANTEGLEARLYYWQTWAEKDGEKFMVDSGQTEVVPGLPGITGNFDGRSDVKKILDAIDAMVAGKATLDQQEYAIGNRQLKRIPIPDLLSLRKTYARLYAGEQRAARLKEGSPFFKTIYARFNSPS
ncbi:MAG: hypothetical protein QOG00_261 [Pyrinomonadaceae bacterium]|nr:hypothetical protein [Pyrinomonadaceae bacterium]